MSYLSYVDTKIIHLLEVTLKSKKSIKSCKSMYMHGC